MNIPTHVGIIMDGNGRWALEKGKKRSAGHKAGAEALEKIMLYSKKREIKFLSVYAFSTDNFKRNKEEVDYLMDLIIYYFNHKLLNVIKEGIKIIFSGRQAPLREDVLSAMKSIEEKTKNNEDCVVNICLNYGGQEEIVDATLKIIDDINDNKINRNDLNKDMFYKYLYNNLPPIDLLIRTGKEHRLSNFMLYSMSYAELYFIDTYFPDFDEKEYEKALVYFTSKDRRFGNIKNN